MRVVRATTPRALVTRRSGAVVREVGERHHAWGEGSVTLGWPSTRVNVQMENSALTIVLYIYARKNSQRYNPAIHMHK